MIGIWWLELQQLRQCRSSGLVHGSPDSRLHTLQIEAAWGCPIAKNDAQQSIYFTGDFLLDGLRRFFSWAVCWACSTGRRRQIFRFTSTRSSVRLKNLRYSSISFWAFRTAAGEGKLCVTVWPSTFWVSWK